jgi:hypothetical protein
MIKIDFTILSFIMMVIFAIFIITTHLYKKNNDKKL